MATVLKLTASEKDFTEALAKASGALGRFTAKANIDLARMYQTSDRVTTQMNRGFSRLSNTLKSFSMQGLVGVTLPLTFMAKSASDAYAEFDSLKRGMNALDPSVANVSKRIKELEQLARLPALGFQEALQADIRMRNVGFTIAETTKIMTEFSNVIAKTGGGKANLAEVTYQLTQMASKGKVLSQDLRPIIENAPAVGGALKSLFGTTASDAISDKLTAQGKSSVDFIRMLLDELSKGSRVAGGYRNALENLSDTLFRVKAKSMETFDVLFGLTAKIGSLEAMINDLYAGFESLPDPMKKLIANSLIIVGTLPLISFAVAKLVDALVFMSRTLMTKTGIIGIAVTALATLGLAFYSAKTASDEFAKATRSSTTIQNEAVASVAVETSKLNSLVEAIKKTKVGSEEYLNIKSAILAINPSFSTMLKDKTADYGKLGDAVKLYGLRLVEASKQEILAKQIAENQQKMDATARDVKYGTTKTIPVWDYAKLMFKDILTEKNSPYAPNSKFAKNLHLSLGATYVELQKADIRMRAELEASIAKYGGATGGTGKVTPTNITIPTTKEDSKKDKKPKQTIWEAYAELHKEEVKAIQLHEEGLQKYKDAIEKRKSEKEDKWREQYVEDYNRHTEAILALAKKRANAEADAEDKIQKTKEEKRVAQQELMQNVALSLAEGGIASAMEGNAQQLNQALASSLNAIGNYAIQLGLKFEAIAKLTKAAMADPTKIGSAVALIAGGIAVKAYASTLKVNKLARGGVTDGNPIFSILGDNPSGKEMALPFERTGEFAKAIASNMKGSQGGNFQLSGGTVKARDIQLILNRLNNNA